MSVGLLLSLCAILRMKKQIHVIYNYCEYFNTTTDATHLYEWSNNSADGEKKINLLSDLKNQVYIMRMCFHVYFCV